MVSDLQELELEAAVSQQLKVHFSYTVSSRLISAISDDPSLSQKKIKENLPLLQKKQTIALGELGHHLFLSNPILS